MSNKKEDVQEKEDGEVQETEQVPFLNVVDTSNLENMTPEEMKAYLDQIVNDTTEDKIQAQKDYHDKEIKDMQDFVLKAKEQGLIPDEEEGQEGGDGSITLQDAGCNPVLKKLVEENASSSNNERLEQAVSFQEKLRDTLLNENLAEERCPNRSNPYHTCTQYCMEKYGQILKPQLPPDITIPDGPTEEQLQADPENPEFDPTPDKRRVNRYTRNENGNPVINLPEGVAGLAADGTEIPIDNSGRNFNPQIPDVFQDREYRNALMTSQYDPDKDKNMFWNPKIKFMVVSVIGPKHCRIKTDRYCMRAWGFAKSKNQCANIADWVKKASPYGRLWDILAVPIGGWFTVPPQFSDEATATYSNPLHQQYMEQYINEQKRATVELEQRVMDEKAASKSKGNTLANQLRQQASERKRIAHEMKRQKKKEK